MQNDTNTTHSESDESTYESEDIVPNSEEEPQSGDPIDDEEVHSDNAEGADEPSTDASKKDPGQGTAHPNDKDRWDFAKRTAKGTPWAVASFFFLTIHSLGVIYGDIGTSPLYVFSSIFGSVDFGQDEVLGAQCLITYTLLVVVLLKYIVIVLSADRHGEGGILALASLNPPTKFARGLKAICVFLSFIGVGFVLGDGAITPAISVLSAIEGLITQYPDFADAEIPVGLFIMVVLFVFQRSGTTKVGTLFGPIMLLWFTANGIIGIINITNHPVCLLAWNPEYAYRFFASYGLQSWTLLGAVVLAITGVEALYADLGHFGKWPIRTSWTFVVLPSLLLTYFGQAGVLIDHPDYISNVYYLALPDSVFWPMFVLALTAAVIASQAMISGTFSLLYQASMFDYFPSLSIVHTSKRYIGQVYIPFANYALLVVTCGLILFFKNSAALAAAYGVCVTGLLCITTIIFVIMSWKRWHVPLLIAFPIGLFFFLIDFAYFTGNIIKFKDGGWVPLLIAFVVLVAFCCWRLGRVDVNRFYKKRSRRLAPDELQVWTENEDITRSPGTGVFFTPKEGVVPKTLCTYVKVTKSLPNAVVLLHASIEDVPRIPKAERLVGANIGNGIHTLRLRNGFMSRRVDALEVLKKADERGLIRLDPDCSRVTFFLPKETLVNKFRRRFWTVWRLGVYNFLAKHAVNHAAVNLLMPAPAVVEVGTRICIKEGSKHLHKKNFVMRFFTK